MGALAVPGGPNHTAVAAAVPLTEEEERNNALFGDLPEANRRKFILVEDPSKNGTKVRVRVSLEHPNIGGMPDSSREINSVYPRSYFPKGMPLPATPSRRNRFYDGDDPEAGSKNDGQVTRGRTLVPIPVMDGEEREVPVPRIARGKQNKERLLNDLGYRMAWGQLGIFQHKKIFLQKARKFTVYLLVCSLADAWNSGRLQKQNGNYYEGRWYRELDTCTTSGNTSWEEEVVGEKHSCDEARIITVIAKREMVPGLRTRSHTRSLLMDQSSRQLAWQLRQIFPGPMVQHDAARFDVQQRLVSTLRTRCCVLLGSTPHLQHRRRAGTNEPP